MKTDYNFSQSFKNSLKIDLRELLTEDEYTFCFGISGVQAYRVDLVRAACVAQEGEQIWVGRKDNFFPDPAFLTDSEMEIFAEEMEVDLEEVEDCADIVPAEIIEKIRAAAK